MREGLSRPLWLALVILAFGAPLFIGLGRTDVENDEGIYSYAVDEMLANGDWLNPRSSPNADAIFLEKPPLKFWIVAAPIALGLLPHDEFGMRFWDALFGAVGFVYVFLIGCRLAGPICGAAAVAVLFVYQPLVFEHGLRGNNMEAPLFLSYCGGVYHYLRWAEGTARRRAAHVVAVALYFFLGFMTKFVAALFLPMVIGVATLLHPAPRAQLWNDRWRWLGAAALFVALAAPWFVYQQVVAGERLWHVILGEHVYARMTVSIDPGHIQPWNFYFAVMYQELQLTGTFWLAIAGGVLLLVEFWRTRSLTALTAVLWYVVPLAIISFGRSKLHHYLYPFLPPVALAAGFAPGWMLRTVSPPMVRAARAAEIRIDSLVRKPTLRNVLLGLSVLAFAVAVLTLVFGPLRWRIGDVVVFRNSLVLRPLLVALLLAVAGGRAVTGIRVILPFVVLIVMLPVSTYRATLAKLPVERHPLRTIGACMAGVSSRAARHGQRDTGVYSTGEQRWFLHSYYYYLRRAGRWEHSEVADPRRLSEALFTPGRQRPVIIDEPQFRAFKAGREPQVQAIPLVPMRESLLILPGPYAACIPSADLR